MTTIRARLRWSGRETGKKSIPAMMAVAGLGTTEVIGWGTAFTPLMVFGATFAADLDISREMSFAGATIMLLVSAIVAPVVGRAVMRHGARPVMMAGSCLLAASMALMATSTGLLTYGVAWIMIGISKPMALHNTAMPGLVEVVGHNARRGIAAVALMSGLTAAVFLPLIALLETRVGWRGTYLVFALLNLLVCLPIHAAVLHRRARASDDDATPTSRTASPADPASFPESSLAPSRRLFAFAMIAVWSCTQGMMIWGINLQIIDVLVDLGMTRPAAIGVWTLTSLAQALARLVDIVFGRRVDILVLAITAASLAPSGFLVLIVLGVSTTTATIFCLLFGIAQGLFSIARNTLPLMLFGQRDYATYVARLSVPQNITNAFAPIVFAAILARFGPWCAVSIAALSATLGCVAVALLISNCLRGSSQAAEEPAVRQGADV